MRSILVAVLVVALGGCPAEDGDDPADPDVNLISNGDFEVPATAEAPVPEWNAINGEFRLDDLNSMSGTTSLRITAPGGAPPDFWANQRLPASLFEAGGSYRLSAWLRAGHQAYVSIVLLSWDLGNVSDYLQVSDLTDWQYVETTFTVPTGTDSFWVIIDVTPFDYQLDADGWFDDVSLVRD